MPPTNPGRRKALADAVIALLAASGVHGVTHRTTEATAGLPVGTASNYFRTREALLVAAAERIVELHLADTGRSSATDGRDLYERLAGSLLTAATAHRARYRAIFELRLEADRRPALATALTALADGSLTRLVDEHRTETGTAIPPEAVQVLMTLYGGALFTLVTMPAEDVTPAAVAELARSIVDGALPA